MPDGFPNHTAEQISRQISAPVDTLTAFTARARVNVRTPEQDDSFTALVRQQRSDSLYMRFSKFGIEGGRLLLTRDSVFFFDTRRAVLRTGSVEDARSLFPAPVSSPRLFENMLGLLSPAPATDWGVEADSALYYLSGPQEQERYVVDPTRWRVVRYTREGDVGTVLEKRHFSEFQTVDGLLVPHRIIFRRPSDDLTAVITYETVTLNPSGLSFQLDVPPSVPRKPFR